MSRRRTRCAAAAVLVAASLTLSACGLPGDGSVHRVDDGEVPYHLLESGSAGAPAAGAAGGPARAPVVFWVAGERLVPEATDDTCGDDPGAVVEGLLHTLATGPSDDARANGRSSAVPPDSGLEMAGLADGVVEVDIEPETSLSADRLPVAVGQIVLTVTSAPGVRSVVLVTDGEPAKVPLPDGALTEGPVTAEDYGDLLPDRLAAHGSFGCSGS
ncbi:GerMN domain-containing protein [Nocardioides mangrovi]|uniref:GerMN domain-containing protein n=1 Tax=Nocardioides mangrovi TaxID=2874580 RepID=A0ABS7UHY8_9ACTN|nr:GerMN domain-containing protein [Nocardioides mangrovi]MBZ5740649.1 GerMN domain-containing protein [Nocardioides mangrovi]